MIKHSTKASSALSITSCLSEFSLFSLAGHIDMSTVNSDVHTSSTGHHQCRLSPLCLTRQPVLLPSHWHPASRQFLPKQ